MVENKCVECGRLLHGWQRKYCCRRCNYDSRNKKRPVVKLKCLECDKEYFKHRQGNKPIRCRSCCSKLAISNRGGISGSKNPLWKGGHKHWQEGKLGRDKDGLSWKVQRRLAWARDKFTWQDCGKKQDGWRPDVHHVVPYRISKSHNLSNLKCLCRSCHKKADNCFSPCGETEYHKTVLRSSSRFESGQGRQIKEINVSKRKVMMRRKIDQAKRAGQDPHVLIPKGCQKKSILNLFEKAKI